MADGGGSIRDDYDLNGRGDFRSSYDYDRAKNNGDIDTNGYDRNGNHYNDYGDRDYDSGRDHYTPDSDSDGDK